MEEQLKALLGENYHEGMTAEEVQTYFQGLGKKEVLESGKYVNKEKSDADINNLKQQLTEKEKALQSKMTDEEKAALAQAAKDQQIEELKALLAKNTLSTNNYKALGLTAEARQNADIKDDDTEFSEFLSNIVSDDEDKTTKVSSYVNKIVKAAYEKGKADATKTKMAGMGNFNKNENNDGDGKNDGSLGSRLAKGNRIDSSKNPYFKI